MAVKALEQQAHAAVLNCRNLNSYASAALSDWGKQCALEASIPRQMAPSASSGVAAGNAAAGTSSFGMSGTNAHLLAAVPFMPSDRDATPAVWRKARLAVAIYPLFDISRGTFLVMRLAWYSNVKMLYIWIFLAETRHF